MTAALAAPVLFAQGDSAAVSVPSTLEDALRDLSNSAGVIFLGEVTAIRHIPAGSIVEIDFRIEQAVRGCTTGSTYTLREWAGLWSGGDERYHIGDRRLMLLHAPSAAGLSSPVGGMDGAIPVRGGATDLPSSAAVATTQSATSLTSAASAASLSTSATFTATSTAQAPEAEPIADLRWIATRVLQSQNFLSPLSQSRSIPSTESASPALPSTPTTTSIPNQQAAVSTVIKILSTANPVPRTEDNPESKHAAR
jgi:hypothetical protein